jgi:hypothetical protein
MYTANIPQDVIAQCVALNDMLENSFRLLIIIRFCWGRGCGSCLLEDRYLCCRGNAGDEPLSERSEDRCVYISGGLSRQSPSRRKI